mgnify:CR=1 FL=1
MERTRSPPLLRRVDASKAAGPLPGHGLLHGGNDLRIAPRAQDAVHLRQLLQYIALVALGHAARDQDFLNPAGALELRHLQNVVNGLLVGAAQKAAGVDHHHIRAVRLRLDVVARTLHQGHHLLAVDLVFRRSPGR